MKEERSDRRHPLAEPAALEPKQRFAVRGGGKTVGSGVVSRVLE